MKRAILALALLAVPACSSIPFIGSSDLSGFTEETMKDGTYRIAYTALSEDVSAKMVADRTLARAAQVTLDKGNEWFEIASKIDGKSDGRRSQTLASLKAKIG